MKKAVVRGASVFGACAVFLYATVGLAQALVTAQSYDHRLEVRIEGPDWIDGTHDSVRVTTPNDEISPVVTMAFVPEEQSFEDWQELFAIRIENTADPSAQQAIERETQDFLDRCNQNFSHAFMFDFNTMSGGDAFFMFVCGRANVEPEVGDVILYYVVSTDGYVIEISHHFRGKTFPLREMSQWPASNDDVDRFPLRMQTLQIFVSE